MKKNMLKLLSTLVVLCFVLSTVALSAFAASDSSTTLHDPGKTAEFNQQDIVVHINGQSHGFSASGNGSWKSNGEVGELNIPAGGSLPVVITSGENTYDASLVNHAAAPGNNGNNDNGKDLYQITDITRRGTDPTPPGDGGIDPLNLDPDEPSGGENPPAGGENPPEGGENPPEGGENPPAGGENPPEGGENPPEGGEPVVISEDAEQIPVAAATAPVPKTGDPMLLLCLVSAASLGGYVMLNKKR